MGRSGLHAIIRWIANGLGGTVHLHSNCKKGWKDKRFVPTKIVKEAQGDRKQSHVIKSIEDFYLPLWDGLDMASFEKFDKIVTIVRSPRNWLASSIAVGGWARDYLEKAPDGEPELPVSRIDAYKSYFGSSRQHIRINYNYWLEYNSNRNHIANTLWIKNVPVPEQCKFSSFKRPYNHNEDRYKLLSPKQRKWFNKMYDKGLERIQEEYFAYST